MTRNPIKRWMTQAVSLKTGQQANHDHATSDLMPGLCVGGLLPMAREVDTGWRVGRQRAGEREAFCVFTYSPNNLPPRWEPRGNQSPNPHF